MKYFFILLLLAISLIPRTSQAEMDGRVKAMLTVTTYGVVGGTLLGVASLAFGAKPRAIAIGASLGLYAGLIFGSYIVVSHHYRTGDAYPGSYGTYQLDDNTGDFGAPERVQSIADAWADNQFLGSLGNKGNKNRPNVYLNILQFQF